MANWAKLAFIGVLLFFLSLFIIFPIFAFNLPSPDKVVRREGFSTKILDRNGKPLYDIYEDKRQTPATFEDMPLYLRQATVAIEDKNFYSHQGFDPMGYVRAVYNIIFHHKLQGGSTLTQQLVKNVLLSSERTIFRKIKEFILATQIERRYTKDEILQMYLNEAPYGGAVWGVEAASETYFGKSVKDLDLVESAILAGIPQSPSSYSPYSSTPKAYVTRAENVLRRMREDGYITSDQEDEAKNALANVEFQEKGASFKAPHFVQYVEKILDERYGANAIEQGGLTVTTTLDLDLQDKAQKIVSDEIAKVESVHITNGASVVLNPETGEVLAMVGSKNFLDPNYDGQVNVTTSLRQPGSAIKPITYVTAFKKGYTPSTLLMDVPTEFPGKNESTPYKPVDYDSKYRGPIQVRYALANSINVSAVKVLAMVGIKDMLQTAYDMGLTSLEPTKETLARVGLSVTLGGGEVRLIDLTSAYSAFVNKGYRVEPVAILKVEDSTGKVLEQIKPKKTKRVLSEEQAFLIASILSDNDARKEIFGTNSLLHVSGRTLAVKTGTTNDKRDNWTIGGNPDVMVGVWVGNNDNSAMKQVASGVSGASPIWRGIVLAALSGKQDKPFEIPNGIVSTQVDTVSGYLAHDGFASRSEYFIKGTEPGEDPVHVKLKLCKNDGKLANPSDVAANNYEEKEFFIFKETDPVSFGGENKWQKGIDEWIAGQGDARYHPPTEYCGATNPLSLNITNPTDHDEKLPSDFLIKITADSTSSIASLDLFIDGERIRGFTSPPYEYRGNISNGIHEIKAHAKDSSGHEAEKTISVAVGVSYSTPTPSPSPTATP